MQHETVAELGHEVGTMSGLEDVSGFHFSEENMIDQQHTMQLKTPITFVRFVSVTSRAYINYMLLVANFYVRWLSRLRTLTTPVDLIFS